MSERQFDELRARPWILEVLFCFSFGVFLAAEGWPAAIGLVSFGLFFFLWLCRLIDLERGEQ